MSVILTRHTHISTVVAMRRIGKRCRSTKWFRLPTAIDMTLEDRLALNIGRLIVAMEQKNITIEALEAIVAAKTAEITPLQATSTTEVLK